MKSHFSIFSSSAIVAILLFLYCDPSDAYSNRLLRFARNDPKWQLPKWQNILDLLTFKRSGGEFSGGDDITDEEVSNIIDEALQAPFSKRGSMRLRRLRREDGDTPEGAPEVDMNIHPALSWRHGNGMMAKRNRLQNVKRRLQNL